MSALRAAVVRRAPILPPVLHRAVRRQAVRPLRAAVQTSAARLHAVQAARIAPHHRHHHAVRAVTALLLRLRRLLRRQHPAVQAVAQAAVAAAEGNIN